jgi:hypothetical protein
MKLITVLMGLVVTAGSAIAGSSSAKIDEEVYISTPSESLIKLISKHPELTMDHISKEGMELYGPVGMKKWLADININFSIPVSHSHSKNLSFAKYPTHEQITKFLKETVALNPSIAKLISIGKSVEGRELWAVKISDNVEIDEVEPEFKYISSMHGNEITGRELTQFLIKDIIESYGKDARITKLVNNTEIYIMPSMNPDGSKRKQRANARGYDLNRDFPDFVDGDTNSTRGRQVETKAVMDFQASRQFSLSANFHGGAIVVNYPWDNTYDLHPFDKLVKTLSLAYAGANPRMRNSTQFENGVINGAKWYVVHGGMQDWSYSWHNDLQVTIELSNKKWPNYKDIPSYYQDNKDGMLIYLDSIHQGAGFKLLNKSSEGSVAIKQFLNNGQMKNHGKYGFNAGEFYKVLPVGNYEFTVFSGGKTKVQNIEVDTKVHLNGNFFTVNN